MIKKTLRLRIYLSTHEYICFTFLEQKQIGIFLKTFVKFTIVFINKVCFWNFKTIFTKMKMKVFSGASCRHRPKSGGGFLHTYLLHKTYSPEFTKLLKTFSPIHNLVNVTDEKLLLLLILLRLNLNDDIGLNIYTILVYTLINNRSQTG